MIKCLICSRETPDCYRERHHLTPHCKKGKDTIPVCIDCAHQIHELFSISELTHQFNTLEKLLANEKVQNWIKWIRKKKEFGFCMKRKKKR